MHLDRQHDISHLFESNNVLNVVAVVGQGSLLLLAQSLTALTETQTRVLQHLMFHLQQNQNQSGYMYKLGAKSFVSK